MKKKAVSGLETLVSIMIFLVVIQTFLEDWTIAGQYPAQVRTAASLAGVVFDLFFTIEFLARLALAVRQGRVRDYFTRERGWIDLLASVPLLLLSSGPRAFAWILGSTTSLELGSLLSLLKVIKTIRIARILRLLRIAKIFRSIKYAESPMAQRHVATVTSTSIAVLVGFLMLSSTVATFVELPGLDAGFAARPALVMKTLEGEGTDRASLEAAVRTLVASDPALLAVRHDGEALFSRYDEATSASAFGAGDYTYARSGTAGGGLLEVFYDLRPYNAQMGRESIVYLLLVIALVLAYVLIYSPHFAMTVTDPIHVMNRGMADKGYNLTVKIPERYAEDDVFTLARQYNEVYLPMKDLSGTGSQESVLTMESADLDDLLAAASGDEESG
jgi:hypothetical protein